MKKNIILITLAIMSSGCSSIENLKTDKGNPSYSSFSDWRNKQVNTTINEENKPVNSTFSVVVDESYNPKDTMENNESSLSSVDIESKFVLTAQEGESLKNRLLDFLSNNGYKMIWNSQYDVLFDNDIIYEGDEALDVVKNISDDLSVMGIDIHMNVYIKNNVVLVYSVRG